MPKRFVCGIAMAVGLWGADYDWRLPDRFPPPPVPADNPMTPAKVELGRYLFYEKRISTNGKQSCGSCHRQELAFTDGRARAEGTTGQLHPRSSMSLVNVAYAPRLTWANPALVSLEDQALIPMLGEEPVELGLKGREAEFLAILRRDPGYQRRFSSAFAGETEPFTLANVTKAIAAFERTIVSMRSPYDRYRWSGEASAIPDSARRGEIFFFSSERAGCFTCHGGWNFSGGVRFEGGESRDMGMGNSHLRTPTLRNIALTAPYMRDGSLATLDDVIAFYAAGGKPNDPARPRPLRPFRLTDNEKTDLVEFLKSLTDQELLRDERWSDPSKPSR